MTETVLFYIFSSITVLMVLLMIFQTNPIASAMFLVFAFFSLAALYVLLQAPFVAMLQIMVYAGAVMVLFIFVIMLLNLHRDELERERFHWKQAGLIAMALAFAGFLINHFVKIPVLPFREVSASFGEVASVGKVLFSDYVIPFELTSILILVAVIGAVLLGKKELE